MCIRDRYKNARRVFQGALMFATASGVIMCSITWFGSNFFADLMKMPEAAYAIRVLAPCILIMAFPVSYTHLDVYKRQVLYRRCSDSGD